MGTGDIGSQGRDGATGKFLPPFQSRHFTSSEVMDATCGSATYRPATDQPHNSHSPPIPAGSLPLLEPAHRRHRACEQAH